MPVEHLSQVLKQALILPGHPAAHTARTMPQATSLIASDKTKEKEPATVM